MHILNGVYEARYKFVSRPNGLLLADLHIQKSLLPNQFNMCTLFSPVPYYPEYKKMCAKKNQCIGTGMQYTPENFKLE